MKGVKESKKKGSTCSWVKKKKLSLCVRCDTALLEINSKYNFPFHAFLVWLDKNLQVIVIPVVYRFCSHSISVTGNTFQGPKQFPFLALLPAEVWSSILIDEVHRNIECVL